MHKRRCVCARPLGAHLALIECGMAWFQWGVSAYVVHKNGVAYYLYCTPGIVICLRAAKIQGSCNMFIWVVGLELLGKRSIHGKSELLGFRKEAVSPRKVKNISGICRVLRCPVRDGNRDCMCKLLWHALS